MVTGKQLKKYRREAGITQKQLAEKAGVSKNHLSAVERDVYQPSIKVLAIYHRFCNVPADEILSFGG